MQDRDAARAQRVMKTMLQMIKLDVARLHSRRPRGIERSNASWSIMAQPLRGI